MESTAIEDLKEEILAVLSHPEAEDGLYLRNFFLLHDEDQRPGVHATVPELLAALNELVREGDVTMTAFENQVVFRRDDQ